jgi:tRNA modification GTPase
VAVVMVDGPSATLYVSRCFRAASGRDLAGLPLDRIVLGRWGGDAATAEELVVCRRSNERVEVHCHGGVAAASAVMKLLVDQGCRRISWADWLREVSFGAIRCAAQIALAEARTARTASILLDQYHGALTAAIQTVIGAVSFTDWPRAATTLEAVLAFRDLGMHLTTPWRVVLTGPTNVGKSSLVNALAGFQRSIVSHQPGTTRDVVTFVTAIDGWPVQFADTAGLRIAVDELESAGVKLAIESVATADLVIAVSDATQPGEVSGATYQKLSSLLSQLTPAQRLIHVQNKVDLLTPAERAHATSAGGITRDGAQPGSNHQLTALSTSATTGEGVADLVSAIGRVLVPRVPSPRSAVPFNAQQLAALDEARNAVESRDASTTINALQSLLSGSFDHILLNKAW